MITLRRDVGDSPAYLDFVEALVLGAVRGSAIPRAHVLKTDSWFSPKWCRFSGKLLGAVSVWRDELTLPPFVPARIVAQDDYERDPATGHCRATPNGAKVHTSQPSSDNLQRLVARFDGEAAFFWYAGSTARTGRGCVMAYVPADDGYAAWYAEIVIDPAGCRLGRLRGTSPDELARLGASHHSAAPDEHD